MKELTTAIKTIKIASELIKQKYGKILKITNKNNNPKDLCTEVDILVENKIIQAIKQTFPDYKIIAEESGKNNIDSDNVWIIDPIDGTKNFIHQIPCFTSSLALIKKNKIVLGVVSDPINNKIYWAVKNKGAYVNNKKILIPQNIKLEKSFAVAEWWSRQDKYKTNGIKIFNNLSKRVSSIRYLSGTAWSLTKLTEGLIDIVTCDTTLLDIAASIIIIKEAGGSITDHTGAEIKPFDMTIKRIVAANPQLHKQVLAMVKQIYKMR